MPYSNDDIENLASHIAKMLRYTGDIDLKDLLKGSKWKEVNFQDECEGGNLLGDLLLKHATENNNSRIKDLFLRNGFKLPQQEQIAEAINKEKEAPNVEENKSDSNEVNPGNSKAAQFSTSYDKIKEIVTKNPDITAGKFNEELKKEKIDTKITNQDGWTLPYYAVRSEGPYITGDRSMFLKTVELFTSLNIRIDFKDTASRTVLGMAAVNKQADVVRILLDSGKFYEEEKFNALRSAIVQGNVQEVEAFLGYVNDESRRAALGLAMNSTQEEITQVLLNFITSETPNAEENIVPAPPIVTEANANQPVSSSVNDQPGHSNENETPVLTIETNTGKTTISDCDNNKNVFTNSQFSMPNEQETKYKESKKDFYTSLTKDVVGVVITGLFITAAVMVPFVAGAVVCSVIAALVAIYTGLHVKNSTLPSYREMRENEVERVTGCHPSAQTLESRRP